MKKKYTKISGRNDEKTTNKSNINFFYQKNKNQEILHKTLIYVCVFSVDKAFSTFLYHFFSNLSTSSKNGN